MSRLFYTAGPGDAFSAFRSWLKGCDDVASTHVGHSRQIFESCIRHGYEALVTCSCPDRQDAEGRGIKITYRPDPTWGKSGLGYHRNLAAKARRDIKDATDFGASVIVIGEDSNPHHYAALARRGIKIVQTIHTRLWPDGFRPSFMQRLRFHDFARAYRNDLFAIVSTSDAISRQVRQIAGAQHRPIIEFQPLYRAGYYSDLAAPDWNAPVLDAAFVGRVEANKGVLDLVRVAKALSDRGVAMRFNICGLGGGLDDMREMVAAEGLAEQFSFHGWCDRQKLKQVLTGCQFSIVPTRRDFIEGFNQVAVESILGGRPAVVSDNCPVVDYTGDSIIVVPSDDIGAYVDVLQNLAADRDELRRRAGLCATDSQRFLDEQYSFGAAIDEVLGAIAQGRDPVARRLPFSGRG